MNEAEIREEILSELGEPVVKVELDETHWKGIFKSAKRWFHAKKGVLGCGLFPAVKEQAIPPEMELIYDVVLPGAGQGGLGCLMTLGFFKDIVPADVLRGNGQISTSFMNYSAWAQLMQQMETVRRVFGSDPDWFVECGKLYITGTSEGGAALILFKKKHWEIEELTDRNEDMFYRFCLNEAKYRLGRIRGKYPNYPTAGGSIDTDARDLLDEYKADKELLEEEIAQSQYPMHFITG